MGYRIIRFTHVILCNSIVNVNIETMAVHPVFTLCTTKAKDPTRCLHKTFLEHFVSFAQYSSYGDVDRPRLPTVLDRHMEVHPQCAHGRRAVISRENTGSVLYLLPSVKGPYHGMLYAVLYKL